MKKLIMPLVACLYSFACIAQNSITIITKDSLTNKVLKGVSASVIGNGVGRMSSTEGKVFFDNVPDGDQTIILSHIGYEEKKLVLNFPLSNIIMVINIFLHPSEEEEEEVIVATTRSSRTISNTPTRVEVIDLEEIDEKTNMRPSNVSMILHESTGIQVQQTSATSANASIRIQGLDGRYTQLLKDGYPNFGNFAGGLSILEIPPLDLKQVEIIKGPASTLYGAGAIAGVINFISKTPKDKAAYNFILNQSNIGQTNAGLFASSRNEKFGYTLLALGNLQKAYDVDKDDFTELPKSKDFTINPRLFFYPSKNSEIIIGNSFTKGRRTGGDIEVIKNNIDASHQYFEKNETLRNNTSLDYTQKFSPDKQLKFKNSLSYFNREITLNDYTFAGKNYNYFSDLSYAQSWEKQTFIIGANFIKDVFKEKVLTAFPLRNFRTSTGGLFVQHTWDIKENIQLETGLRTDLVDYGNDNYQKTEVFILPRVSALFRFSSALSSRFGGGLGYKTPTIFTEETETIQYRNVLPLKDVSSEKSYGGTADINYNKKLNRNFNFSLNHMFFITRINNSTILNNRYGSLFFQNAREPVISKGFETNAKLIFRNNFKFFGGYTFTDARAKYLPANQFLPLVPKHKVNLALVYEKENDLKIGLEGYYTGKQYFTAGAKTPDFWEFGAMAEKYFGKISFYINAENVTDMRQSRYAPVVSGGHIKPDFAEIWSHTEGFVLSGGIKVKL